MLKKRLTRLTMAIVAVFILLSNLGAQEASPTVTVSLVITGGIPSPSWSVQDPKDIAKLREFVRGLPDVEPIQEPPFGGFLLTSDESKCHFPSRVRVVEGKIVATTAGGVTRFFQDSKGLSSFLREEATKRNLGRFLPP